MEGDLSGRFVRHEQSRSVKAPDFTSVGNTHWCFVAIVQLLQFVRMVLSGFHAVLGVLAALSNRR
jgi:hypothetical protein